MTVADALRPDLVPRGAAGQAGRVPHARRGRHVLYVGKARHLRNRVASYSTAAGTPTRRRRCSRRSRSIEVTVTASETEALLLENNLIKSHRPRYNVLLQGRQELSLHPADDAGRFRGSRSIAARGKVPGRFFGPYPSAVAVRETLQLLQKLFRLRPCEDTFFPNRSRPCLQYQIGRCTAPCVGLVDARGLRAGRRRRRQVPRGPQRRADRRTRAAHGGGSAAPRVRSAPRGCATRSRMLKQIQASQSMTRIRGTDIDAVAHRRRGRRNSACRWCSCAAAATSAARNFFPRGGLGGEPEMLAGIPRPVLPRPRVARRDRRGHAAVEDADVLEAALRQRAGRAVPLRSGVRGTRARWLEMARTNAELGLRMQASSRASVARPARGAAADPGSRTRAAAHRVLRHQPHHGRVDGRVLRGVRQRRSAQERLPAFQHRRASRRATTTPACARRSSGALRASSAARARCRTCC